MKASSLRTKPCKHCQTIFEYCKKSKQFCSLRCQQLSKRAEKFVSEPGMVKCAICQFEAHDLVGHITRTHNLPLENYRSIYPDAQTRSTKYLNQCSEKIKGSNNPGWKHNGRFSALSTNFVHAATTDRKTVASKISKANKENGNTPTTLKYWMAQGYSEVEAKIKLSERQTTFSKEICIAKYGEEDGIRRWNERQEKWIKNNKKCNFSQVSQKLFWSIYHKLENRSAVHFATLFDGQRDDSGKNHERPLSLQEQTVKPDFYDDASRSVIEFDGDYWHGTERGNQQRDKIREAALIHEGYRVLRIAERDYKADPEGTLQKCLNFLKHPNG